MEPAPFQAFPLRSREQSELILSAALLSSLTLFHVQLRGKCPHSEAKAPIIIENPGSICVRAGSGPKVGSCRGGLFLSIFPVALRPFISIYIYINSYVPSLASVKCFWPLTASMTSEVKKIMPMFVLIEI